MGNEAADQAEEVHAKVGRAVLLILTKSVLS